MCSISSWGLLYFIFVFSALSFSLRMLGSCLWFSWLMAGIDFNFLMSK